MLEFAWTDGTTYYKATIILKNIVLAYWEISGLEHKFEIYIEEYIGVQYIKSDFI